MPRTQEVRASLGCGTLILIAVIVILFGGHQDHDNLENKIDDLSRELQGLRQDIHSLKNSNSSSGVESEVERVLTERERRHVKILTPKFREVLGEMTPEPAFAEEPQTYAELFAPLVRIIEEMVAE